MPNKSLSFTLLIPLDRKPVILYKWPIICCCLGPVIEVQYLDGDVDV